MSRYKILPLILVVGLLSLLIPLTIALADGGGTVSTVDSDGNNNSNQINIELTGLRVLGADQAYEGWLVSVDGSRKESTGILTPDGDGNVSSTFSLPDGENRFADFDKFVLTIEPVPDADAGPSADVELIHITPAEAFLHIGHLTYSWAGNPAYTSGFHEGTPKGITVGLREQTNTALAHSRLSVGSADLAGVQAHACHVVNIVEGTEGANFDATCGNPGDGFGVLNYAADTKHAGFAASAVPDDTVIGENSNRVAAAAAEVTAWAGLARDQALLAIGSNDIDAAKLFVSNAEARLISSLNSANTAYTAAQDMGMHTLAAPPPAAPPDTGDPIVPNLALGVLIAGAILLMGGAYIYRRSRIRAGQTS